MITYIRICDIGAAANEEEDRFSAITEHRDRSSSGHLARVENANRGDARVLDHGLGLKSATALAPGSYSRAVNVGVVTLAAVLDGPVDRLRHPGPRRLTGLRSRESAGGDEHDAVGSDLAEEGAEAGTVNVTAAIAPNDDRDLESCVVDRLVDGMVRQAGSSIVMLCGTF